MLCVFYVPHSRASFGYYYFFMKNVGYYFDLARASPDVDRQQVVCDLYGVMVWETQELNHTYHMTENGM